MKTITPTRGDKPDVEMCLRCGELIIRGPGERRDGYCGKFCRSQARLRAKMDREKRDRENTAGGGS